MYSRNRFEVGVEMVPAWVDVSKMKRKKKGLRVNVVMGNFIFVIKD